MNNSNSRTIPEFGDGNAPLSRTADEDAEMNGPGFATRPAHVVREDVPAISEDEPPPPRESDVTLEPPDPKMPDVDAANEKWKLEVHDAAIRWDRLTEEDLASLTRHEASLSDLVQTRYGLSAAETALQLTAFIEDHQLFAL